MEIAATPNLAFPTIHTTVIEWFYQKETIYEVGDDGLPTDTIIGWQIIFDENGNPIPIEVTEVIGDTYTGDFDGMELFYYQPYVVGEDGCAVDLLTQTWVDSDGDGILELEEWLSVEGADGIADKMAPIPSQDWLDAMSPWYDQPTMYDGTINNLDEYTDLPDYLNPNLIWTKDLIADTEEGGRNSWQADWLRILDDDEDPFTPVIRVDFIDWGNPLDNNNPVVGQRFPVEFALYQKIEGQTFVTPEGELNPDAMTRYKTSCVEYNSSRNELFGVSEQGGSAYTTPIRFATVITNRFTAEVWNPDGTRTTIPIAPAIGPSGKMNLASAGGGWTPTMPGVHRIWFHFQDPLISLAGAIVNDDDHYIMSSGCKAEDLSHNKLAMSGIVGNSTYIDVLVLKPSGGKKK